MKQSKMQRKMIKEMENATYPSFWGRAAAYFIDSIIFIPFFFLLFKAQLKFRNNEGFIYLCLALNFSIGALFSIYRIFFTKKINGTPGKLLCKFKIVRDDGLPITWGTAVKRELIVICISILYYLLFCSLLILNRHSINTYADATANYSKSIISKINTIIMWVVYLIDYGKINSSPKRQALHDKIANTVVVYKYTTELKADE
ncbi:MAG: RDD family protein [Spirochaetaceae bacterium]|nr:RDD family protein [Spirochaetaceae bacterium]